MIVADTRRRLLFVHPTGAGGAAVSLRLLLDAFPSSRFERIVLLFAPNPSTEKILGQAADRLIVRPELVPIFHAAVRWGALHRPLQLVEFARSLRQLPQALHAFGRILDELRPHLTYCNTLPAAPYGPVARRRGIPTVLHVREHVADGHVGLRTTMVRSICEQFDHVFFISPIERDLLRLSAPQSVVFNYVDTREWCPRPTTRSHSDPVRLLYMGGLNSIKGLDVLLESLSILHRHGERLRCNILGVQPPTSSYPLLKRAARFVGYSTQRRRLEEAVAGPLREVLRIEPFISDVRAVYLKSDVLVFPAIVDHFARPIIEAGAAGLPSVSSDLPGACQVMVDRETGYLVSPGDPESLAQAIRRLVVDPEMRIAMGQRARMLVEERFSHRNARTVVEVVEHLLSDSTPM